MEINKDFFAETIAFYMKDGQLDIIEAVVEFCNINEMDMNDLTPLLDNTMIERIRVSAIENKYVLGMKLNKLPI